MTVRPDPPVRADGLCVVCLGPRRVPASLRRHRVEAEADPFCSMECCRVWQELGDDDGAEAAA